MERKNICIVILMITTIIAACFAIYFYINPVVNTNETVNENEVVKQENVITPEINDNEEITNNVKDETTNSEIKVEEKIIYKYLPSVENGKCLNAKENLSYSVIRSADFQGVAAYIKESGKLVLFTVNWDRIKDAYGSAIIDENMTGYNEYSITNFSKKVVNVYIDGMGQAIGSEVLLFLMEDGTVEYMPLRESLIKEEFKSYGQIKNVSNVVDIVGGTVRASIDGGPGPGWYTIFAINNEGNYYDIGDIIQDELY